MLRCFPGEKMCCEYLPTFIGKKTYTSSFDLLCQKEFFQKINPILVVSGRSASPEVLNDPPSYGKDQSKTKWWSTNQFHDKECFKLIPSMYGIFPYMNTIKINQMQVNIPYMDGMGNNSKKYMYRLVIYSVDGRQVDHIVLHRICAWRACSKNCHGPRKNPS